jgi:hypothetical protein
MLPGAGSRIPLVRWNFVGGRSLIVGGGKDRLMLILEISGGVFVFLFIAAAMAGIEGNEHR